MRSKKPIEKMWSRIETDAVCDTRKLCAAIVRMSEQYKAILPSEYDPNFIFHALNEATWQDVRRIQANLETAQSGLNILAGTSLERYRMPIKSTEPA
ncbi:hypothetical protein ACFSE1_09975 [Rhizobium helianthi]|uniref:Uncharacterized protein n=1 Tax=Rhizobium helianthi TaxID=1132695 RepID=A0ABW4M2Y6_9HYPH